MDKLAETIYHREGPSGPNKVSSIFRGSCKPNDQDYVYKLAESVRKLYPDVRDDYLFELEVRSRPNLFLQASTDS